MSKKLRKEIESIESEEELKCLIGLRNVYWQRFQEIDEMIKKYYPNDYKNIQDKNVKRI